MKTVLLDRDGTIVIDPPDKRIDSVEKLALFPDTLEALHYLAEHGYNVIIITNQRGIAEGRITTQQFETINAHFITMLQPSGIEVLKTYMSPFGKNDVNDWQKPGPGMLLQAAKDFNLDLAATYMVGDRETDVQAGKSAGSKTILIKTLATKDLPTQADYASANLVDAVRYIVENS
jgi:histidinol-phosphate phosphatase family protein